MASLLISRGQLTVKDNVKYKCFMVLSELCVEDKVKILIVLQYFYQSQHLLPLLDSLNANCKAVNTFHACHMQMLRRHNPKCLTN